MSPADQTPIIELEDINLRFSEQTGIFDLSLTIPEGIIFGLIGPSGCGKTTTVRLLTGLYKPESGTLRVMGYEPSSFSAHARLQIDYMPQQFILYPHLTVQENLHFAASIYGVAYGKRHRRFKDLLEFVQLSDVRRQFASKLSGGMQRRLALACTLVHEPKLIFADEPTAGIDPVLRGKFWEYFRQLRNDGQTLIVTTQYVGEAAYCDLVGVMRAGRLIHIDTPDGLRRKALGGEIIRLIIEPEHTRQLVQIFRQHPEINEVQRERRQPGHVYVYVDNAAEMMPFIFNVLQDHPDITVQQAEEYRPPFDDIFIRLLEQAELSNG